MIWMLEVPDLNSSNGTSCPDRYSCSSILAVEYQNSICNYKTSVTKTRSGDSICNNKINLNF
jgi:hypothetical protein